ncbi:hypothetical protein RB195_000219 [Necator americanus]|uniref:non-specific serine/threonine protein kinase n=1 Tax=Necator americanus TaxID=51031 RepID=A0ABR1D9Z7_NECAM
MANLTTVPSCPFPQFICLLVDFSGDLCTAIRYYLKEGKPKFYVMPFKNVGKKKNHDKNEEKKDTAPNKNVTNNEAKKEPTVNGKISTDIKPVKRPEQNTVSKENHGGTPVNAKDEKQKGECLNGRKDVKLGKESPREKKEGMQDSGDKKAKLSKDSCNLNGELEKKAENVKEGKGNEEAKKDSRKKPHLLKEGDILLKKFRVEGLLADGGFAQIFAAIHEDTQTRWAVKIESEKCDRKRMKLEIMVLMLLRGKANIPEIMAMGTCPTGHFIILELVGRNLSDLRRQLPQRKLNPGSLYRSMLQVTHALSLVHGAGFLHRDLKPSNCCVGVDDVTRIYLLDYGLTRQYLDSSGQIRKPRVSIGMRGTLRYVSLEAHARHDLGPNHDLVALLYSIIELGDGSLPWSKMREESAIKASKQETSAEKLCEKQPKMLKMAEYVLSMKYETMPDYDKLTKLLESCNPPDVKSTDPYDWQITPCQLDHYVQRERPTADMEKPDAEQKKDNSRGSLVLTDPDKPKA